MPMPGLGVNEGVMGWKRGRPDEAETDASGSRRRIEGATAGDGDGDGDKPAREVAPPEFLCPITHDVMRDPVSAADGHTYERKAIARWLETRRTSPKTNEPLESVALVANLSMRSLISSWMEKSGRRFPRPGELCEAASKGDVEEVRALLRAGADCDDKHEDARERGSGWMREEVRGMWTALMVASEKGHRDVVELLVGAGADVNQAGWCESTALMWASEKGHRDVVELLVGAGADVNRADKDGTTALMEASEKGHRDVAELLVGAGVDVNQADKDGDTALMMASRNGHRDVAELLVGAGADVNRARENGLTALMLASRYEGHCDVAELLVGAGADVNRAREDGRTALMMAIQDGNRDVVELLVGAGADVNLATKRGDTAMMMASLYSGNRGVAELLVGAGADVNRAREDGRTALMWASDIKSDLRRLGGQTFHSAATWWSSWWGRGPTSTRRTRTGQQR